jgi:hypothetical protein
MTVSSAPVRLVSDPRALTYTAAVNAPASELFSILSNPHRHHEVDGSGSVQSDVEGPTELSTGDTFTTHMHLFGLDYTIKNHATAVEENRLVEWQHPGGHLWRWEFEDLGNGTTQVTESWIRGSSPLASFMYLLLRATPRNDDGIRTTLANLQARYAN